MKTNKDPLFQKIFLMSIALSLIVSGVILLITQNTVYVLSVLFGTMLSCFGFELMILTSNAVLFSKKGNILGGITFLLRYAIYALAMYIAATFGANILCMLAGFLSISISIKIVTFKMKGEDS